MTVELLAQMLLVCSALGVPGRQLRAGLELCAGGAAARRRSWCGRRRKPPYLRPEPGIGVMLGLLLLVKACSSCRRAVAGSVFGELMMFVYFGYLLPLSTRITRGLYADGIWTDTGFMPYAEIGGISWREGDAPTLVVISRLQDAGAPPGGAGTRAGRGAALLRDKIGEPRHRDRRRARAAPGRPRRPGQRVDEVRSDRAHPRRCRHQRAVRDRSPRPVGDAHVQASSAVPAASRYEEPMAARPTWKGYLKVSLVNIPVKVYPGDRVERDDLVQPAPRRVPDPHQAEEVVPEVRARSHLRRGRQGLRVREGPLGRRRRRGHRQGPHRVDQGHQPGAVRRRRRHRSDVRGPGLLPGARRRRWPPTPTR